MGGKAQGSTGPQHRSALAAVAKMNVYIADFDSYPQFNEVTKEIFRETIPPARSVLVAPRRTGAALLRVDLLAVLTASTERAVDGSARTGAGIASLRPEAKAQLA